MSLTGKDLLGGPPPTLLPEEPEPRDLLERGAEPADVAVTDDRGEPGIRMETLPEPDQLVVRVEGDRSR